MASIESNTSIFSSSRSVYLQVADRICKSIATGELSAFDRLPTESQLAEQIGVNRLTVSRGYGSLQRRGIITQRRGQGSFVSSQAGRLLGLPPRRRLRNVACVLHTNKLTDIPSQTQFLLLDMLFGVSRRFEGLAINVCHVPVNDPAQLQREWAERFDAFLIIDRSSTTRPLVDLAHQINRPCVMIWPSQLQWPDLDSVPIVSYDRQIAARMAVEHLISCGYRRIGFVGSCSEAHNVVKVETFFATMQDHGLSVPPQWVRDATVNIGGAYRAIHALLADGGPLPQAFFVDTDYKALEVMQALLVAGVRVPDQVAICGYDDIADAATSQPALTTIHTPRQEAGYHAADLLINWLPDQPTPDHVVLPSQLMVRQTTPPISTKE